MLFWKAPRGPVICLDFKIDQSPFRQSIALLVLLPSFVHSLSVCNILSEKTEALRLGKEREDDVEDGLANQLVEELAYFGRKKE